MSIELNNFYRHVQNSLMLCLFIIAAFLIVSRSIDLTAGTYLYVLISTFLTASVTFSFMNTLFKERDKESFYKRVKTLPVNSVNVFTALLLVVYLNFFFFLLFHICIFTIVFSAEFSEFLPFLCRAQLFLLAFVTSVFIIRINKLMKVLAVLLGTMFCVLFWFSITVSEPFKSMINLVVRLGDIQSDIYYILLILIIVLVITGAVIYRKRHYKEG